MKKHIIVIFFRKCNNEMLAKLAVVLDDWKGIIKRFPTEELIRRRCEKKEFIFLELLSNTSDKNKQFVKKLSNIEGIEVKLNIFTAVD